MGTVAIFLLIVAAVAAVYGVARAVEAYHLWCPPQFVHCPETGRRVHVRLDATLAALTAVPGPAKLMMTECELWPERQHCEQLCAERA
jgi:hypothetical protein